jgi:hypothetical protein
MICLLALGYPQGVGEVIILEYHIHKNYLEYFKVWGYLTNIILPEPKIRKRGFKICDYDFIGFACDSSCYRFLTIKSNVLDYNIIIKSNNNIFFEHVK